MVGRRRVWFEAGIWPCDQTGNVGRRAVRDVGRGTTFHVGSCESSVLTTGRRLDVPPSVRGPRVSGVRRLWPSGRPLLKRGSLLCLRLPGSAGGVAASGSRDFWNGLEPARGPGLGSSAAPSRCDSAGALPCGLAAAARSAPARRRRGQGRRPHAGRRGGLRPRLGQLGACPQRPSFGGLGNVPSRRLCGRSGPPGSEFWLRGAQCRRCTPLRVMPSVPVLP